MSSEPSVPEPHLLSRVAVTWIELMVVGITGGVAGSAVGGPPGLIVYLVTTLLSTGVVLYNVDQLITRRLAHAAD